jgi:hypothetical protein
MYNDILYHTNFMGQSPPPPPEKELMHESSMLFTLQYISLNIIILFRLFYISATLSEACLYRKMNSFILRYVAE